MGVVHNHFSKVNSLYIIQRQQNKNFLVSSLVTIQMRLFIFAILVTAFVAVTPQNEGRTRTRGLRRFSLSTPALKAAKTTDANELIEENLTNPQAPSEPQTRSRGTNTLRSRRPSLRMRGKTSEHVDASPVTTSDATGSIAEPSENSEGRRGGGGGGGGLRIRRPLKKITTTTTTTTTTEQPIAENVANESLPEMQQSIFANEHMEEKKAEGMLTEESNAVLKDEVIQEKTEKLMTEKKMEKPVMQEEPIKEEVISEPMPESLPKMKKLRPIPIKIRRRGKEGKSEPEESPRHIAAANPEPEQVAADTKPVSSHRFSSRPRPRLQTRKRPVNRESTPVTEAERGPVSSPAEAEQNVESEAQQRLRSRGDVPSLRRRPSRISSGQKPAEVIESQPEKTFAEDVAFEEFQPESRNTEINQLEKPLRETPVIGGNVEPAKKRVRIKARIQKPSASIDTVKDQATKDLNSDVSDSLLGAPISDAVKSGRPNAREQVSETESPKSKFRTPNYGGSDLIFKGGEVQITQIGTIEDTPIDQVHSILSGFGSRKRGLARPNSPKEEKQVQAQTNVQINSPAVEEPATDSLTASSNDELTSNLDALYDYYEY